MPVYNYVAKDNTGKIVRGTDSASNTTQLNAFLKQKGLVPMQVIKTADKALSISSDKKKSFEIFSDKVKVRDIAIFCRQFATVLKAGVTVLKGIDILRKQSESKALKAALSDVYDELQKGNVLSEALSRHHKIFPAMLINMVEAGEVSGTLEISFEKMAVHFEKEFKLKQKIKSALTYPSIIIVVCLIAVTILLTFVVPQFSAMFDMMDVKLPATTQLLINSGNFMKNFWYVVILIIGGLVGGFIAFKKSERGGRLIDEFVLKIPFVSTLLKKFMAATFTRTMATLLISGIPLIKSIELCQKIIENLYAQEKLDKVKEQVIQGGSLAEHLESVDLFPVMVPQMISVGEESGAIDHMLERTAEFFDEEVDTTVGQLTTLIEPAVIVFMAVVVGFIVISIIQPMFQMYTDMK
ncbi:MAG: type II secretion system F family protein [Deltaproteobacteria bacterium]